MSGEQVSATDESTRGVRVSTCFNHPTSDVTLQSSDHVLFKVHRRNLEMHSQVFADAAGATSEASTQASSQAQLDMSSTEIVPLSETSLVLELMLQYMYLQPQPDLRKVDFEVINDLAEAVEKYVVYSAMGVLNAKMTEHIATHPIPVLLYAIRHGYPQLITESAEATLDFPPYTMLQKLPGEVFGAWISYQQTYHILLSKEYSRFGSTRYHTSTTNASLKEPCKSWSEHYAIIAAVLGGAFSYSGNGSGSGGRNRSGSGWGRVVHNAAGGANTGPRSWASLANSSTRASPSTSFHHSLSSTVPTPVVTTLHRFFSTLERRLLVSGLDDASGGNGVVVINPSHHGGCVDCKRELGHWLQQAERDWKEWREGREGGRFEEYL